MNNIKTLIISGIAGIVGGIVGGYLIAPIIFIIWAGGSIERDYRLNMYEVARFFGLTDRYIISYIIAFAITFMITLGITYLITNSRRIK